MKNNATRSYTKKERTAFEIVKTELKHELAIAFQKPTQP